MAEPADAPVVAELLDAFNREFDTPTPGAEVLTTRLRQLLPRENVLALLAGDPAVGVALLTFRPSVWDPGPVALLEELYVRPELRRRKIGHTILDHAMAIARKRGSETFEINVDEGDVDARRFYENHGFANTEPGQNERLLYYHRRL